MNHEPETDEQWARREADRMVANMITSLNAQTAELAKACGEVDCQCLPISDSERAYLGNLYEIQNQQSFARSIFENGRQTKTESQRLRNKVYRLKWVAAIGYTLSLAISLAYIANKIGLI